MTQEDPARRLATILREMADDIEGGLRFHNPTAIWHTDVETGKSLDFGGAKMDFPETTEIRISNLPPSMYTPIEDTQ